MTTFHSLQIIKCQLCSTTGVCESFITTDIQATEFHGFQRRGYHCETEQRANPNDFLFSTQRRLFKRLGIIVSQLDYEA